MTDKAYAVPLHEELAGVPRNAKLVVDDADGMGTSFIPVGRMCHEAAEALRARLAQPEPEAVAWGIANTRPTEKHSLMMVMLDEPEPSPFVVPLYTAPPQREWMEQERAVGYREGHQAALKQRVWQGLTDEEMFAALVQADPLTKRLAPGFEYFARAIEAKLKEKNNG